MPRWFAGLGLLLSGLIVSLGTLWAFQRGAPDFSVFFEAWKLAASGRSSVMYTATPDRFLYAPGFGWFFAPVGFLPRGVALAGWCFAKAAAIGLLIRAWGGALSRFGRQEGIGVAAWGFVLLARPFLIDFQYGQVNTFILAACVWALLGHFKSDSGPKEEFLAWFFFAIAAVTKLIALPLFLVPFFVTSGVSPNKLWRERAALVSGTALMLALPLLGGGFEAAGASYRAWAEALVARGLPLESHNQSFAAFVHHVFSGAPIHVISWGPDRVLVLGRTWLSEPALRFLSLGWSLCSGGFLFGWIISARQRSPIVWIALVTGMLILPLHLVWKPYFLFGLPGAVLAVARWREISPVLLTLFVAINFTGFDYLGPEWGGRLEAGALLFWCHLAILFIAARFRSGIPT